MAKKNLLNSSDKHVREIFKGAFVAMLLKILSAGLVFLFNIILTRTIGAKDSGIYFLAMTVTTIAILFGRMGLDNTLTRFTSAHTEVQEWSAVKGVYQKGMQLAFLSSMASATVVFLTSGLLANYVFHKPDLTDPLRYLAFSIVPATLMILHAQMLQGLKQILAYLFVQWQGVGVSICSIIGVFILGPKLGLKGAIYSFNIAIFIMLIAGFLLWRRATPHLLNVKADFQVRELLKSSMPLFWIMAMNYVISSASTSIMLGIWWTAEDVGIYNVATRTSQLTSFVLAAVNAIAAPKFAALYKRGDMEALSRVARKSTQIATFVALPFLLVFLIAPGWIMDLFGKEFSRGTIVLSIMAVGQFIGVAMGSVGYLLAMCGKEETLKNNNIISAIVNVLLNFALIPTFGILGASIADSLTMAYKNISASFLVKKHINIVTFSMFG